MGYSTFTYNGLTFDANVVSAPKVPATRKQKLGQTLVQNQVFTNLFDYDITIQGTYEGTSAQIDTFRTNLEASQDNLKHVYSDGVSEHSGSYIITSLSFDDEGANASGVNFIDFTLTLIQDQFTGGTT